MDARKRAGMARLLSVVFAIVLMQGTPAHADGDESTGGLPSVTGHPDASEPSERWTP